MREVDILVDSSGEIIIDVIGVRGAGCKEIVAPLLENLGEITKSEKKKAYFESRIRTEVKGEQNLQRNGDVSPV